MSETEATRPIVELKNLTQFFSVGSGFRQARLRALSSVSLSLHAGQVLALVGESGSGKSTIAKVLCRLVQPTSGQLLFKGRDMLQAEPRRASLAYRGKVQMIFQDPFGSLNPLRSVKHHLVRPLLRHGKARASTLDEAVFSLLATVGLNPPAEFCTKLPHQMSGGQRQRVAIARALAVEPEVVLADEPISMLDVSIRMGILNLMAKLKEERNLAYLYITHDIASARHIGDRIMVMVAGEIVESAASDELIERAAHPYTRLLLSAVPDPTRNEPVRVDVRSGAPRLLEPLAGCSFAERCPQVKAVCRKRAPKLVELSPGHRVRCHLYQT